MTFPKITILFAALLVSPAKQESSVLIGRVRDSEGAAISKASLIIHWDPAGSSVGLDTNVGITGNLTAETDREGKFSVNLPPGFYDIFVSSIAFSPACSKVRLKPGGTGSLDVKLSVDPQVAAELDHEITASPK